MDKLEIWIENLLTGAGATAAAAPYFRLLILMLALAILAGILYWITKKFVIRMAYKFFERSPMKWDDGLAEHKVLNKVAHIIPAVIVKIYAQILFQDFEALIPIVIRLTDIYIVLVFMAVIFSLLRLAESGLSKKPVFVDKPLSSYFQLVRIILYVATTIIVLSILMSRSPVYFLSAFGALSAVLLLVFKDTILGLVASVQISTNEMIKLGDWVEMPKYNADGDVIAINLNTVKIKNWDKTVTTIPTYYFVTDSFKNWRGMQESGGRRIKRALYIDVHSVKFVDPETRERYKSYYLLKDYIDARQTEIEQYNTEHDFDTSVLINGRRMTNIGCFRHYVMNYLKNHPRIRQDMTLLVRQLGMEASGIPLEIYCFTSTVKWAEYEDIQADIFDHLLAAATFFDLEIFQQPGGSDIVKGLSRPN